jgi:hypothetical protein
MANYFYAPVPRLAEHFPIIEIKPAFPVPL